MTTMMWTLEQIAFAWGMRCFGHEHMYNIQVRALRFAEEAVELAQSANVSEEKMIELVKAVYARPQGDPYQEVGGCMVTLSVFGRIMQIGLEEAFLSEVQRCLSKSPEHFAKRNEEKLKLGLA